MTVNKLILRDNLKILKVMEAESIDLIYLDPPFSATGTGSLRENTNDHNYQ